MGLKTREEYYAELRAMRKNVWQGGERIDDLVTNPFTRGMVEAEAVVYDWLQDPRYDDMLKKKSPFGDYQVVRWNTLMENAEDLMRNMEMKRHMFEMLGVCQAGECVGWNASNAVWAITYDMDKKYGTDYHKRLENWFKSIERKSVKISGALSDAKGDRSQKVQQQANPDSAVHIVDTRPDGIVVSGTKALILNAAAAHEIFVIPGSGYKADGAKYAVAFAVPRDIEGLEIVQVGGVPDGEKWDMLKYGGQTSYLIFENCFIPNERVFLNGEYEFSNELIGYFTSIYRACFGACMCGQGNAILGAGILMARANGLPAKTFNEHITDVGLINNLVYAAGLGAIQAGRKHESGAYFADSALAHTNKYWVARLYTETRRIIMDVTGGIAENGGLPSYSDVKGVMGPKMLKAMQANEEVSAENRVRAARLANALMGSSGFINGGGSPSGARMVVRAAIPIEKYAAQAAAMAGIMEEIKDPVKAK
jgi:4-hydroxybutyryl-CoA dehydratase/vinylacetyl-CoA-Delta-isomerase